MLIPRNRGTVLNLYHYRVLFSPNWWKSSFKVMMKCVFPKFNTVESMAKFFHISFTPVSKTFV